jgi:ATP-dependent DNA helicase RecQ
VEARKALSCVYRVGQRFGIRYVVEVLRGADSEQIRQRGHERLSTFGIGTEHGEQEWISIVRQLIHRGYLEQDIAAWSVLKLTPRAGALLRGEETLELARPRIREKAKKKKLPRSAAPLGPAELELFESLRALRKRLADEQGVPPYVVFGDASLVEMSRSRPATAAEFLDITGVGQVKLERYGQIFLSVILSTGVGSKDPTPVDNCVDN